MFFLVFLLYFFIRGSIAVFRQMWYDKEKMQETCNARGGNPVF